MIDNATLLQLASTDLPVFRGSRFDGTGSELPFAEITAKDVDILRRIYDAVNGVSVAWKSSGPNPDWRQLGEVVKKLPASGLFELAHSLGTDTLAKKLDSPCIRKVFHDIRGGGLTVMLGSAQLFDALGDTQHLRTCLAAARDHAKIMRCLLPEVDPPARAHDEAAKSHNISHFTDKWLKAQMQGANGSVTVSVTCDFRGDISARCLETASIDRVVYNMMNNAARFTTDGHVQLTVLPVATSLTRWVIGNRVSSSEARFLQDADLKTLFAGVTRGGNGVGLANCAEIVAECFGLTKPATAVDKGYVGAALHQDTFFAWFHWPVFASSPA